MNAIPAGAPPGDAEIPPRKPLLCLVKGLAPTLARPAPAPARSAPGIPPRPAPVAPHPAPGVGPRPSRHVPPRASRHVPPQPPQEAPLRLTRRGRVVVAALTVIAAIALSLFTARAAQATHYSLPPRHDVVQVTVRPGQSLWSVADSADPGQDTRLVVKQIIDLNSLSSDTVFAGQQLRVPRG